MKEILLILFGFALGQVPDWIKRKRRLRAHWTAVWAEVNICTEMAMKYTDDNIAAPLYRLPTDVYDSSFTALLGEGDLESKEAAEISIFFNLVKEINRGLDNAAEMYKIDDTDKLKAEYSRNVKKAEILVEMSTGEIALIIRNRSQQSTIDKIENLIKKTFHRK